MPTCDTPPKLERGRGPCVVGHRGRYHCHGTPAELARDCGTRRQPGYVIECPGQSPGRAPDRLPALSGGTG